MAKSVDLDFFLELTRVEGRDWNWGGAPIGGANGFPSSGGTGNAATGARRSDFWAPGGGRWKRNKKATGVADWMRDYRFARVAFRLRSAAPAGPGPDCMISLKFSFHFGAAHKQLRALN
jgi:hypothetical protein